MSKLIGKDTNKDIIVAYLRDPENVSDKDMTAKQRDLLNWYVDAYTVFRNYSSIPDTINVLQKLGKQRGTPISMATARRYVYDALDVFGAVSEMKSEAIKHLVVEMLLDARTMAYDQNNPSALIQAAKELKSVGMNEDPNAINKDDLEQHIIQINLDPKALKVVDKLTTKGPLDLDVLMGNVMSQLAEDADFTEAANDAD